MTIKVTEFTITRDLQVGPSPIHGRGLFTRLPIRAGELIGVYEGRIVTDMEEGDEGYDFVMWMEDEDGRMFGIMGDGLLRFMNHLDESNAVMSGTSPFVYARRPIAANEEITICYEDGWEAA